MNVTDPVADMLTRIRNASSAKLDVAEIPHSILKGEIARILKREGYVADYVTEGHGGKKNLRVFLKYGPGAARPPVIRGIRRISKPGLRRYAPADKLPRVMAGMGLAILSTSKGILTDREAREQKTGGEVMCHVW